MNKTDILTQSVNDKYAQEILEIKYNPKSVRKLRLEIDNFDMSKVLKQLSEPPNNLSQSTQNDLLELSKLTRYRTTEETEMVMMVDNKVEDLFKPYLQKHGLEYPESTVKKFWDLYYPIVTNIKNHYNRARPHQLAPRYGIVLDPIITPSSETPSYPSGHSTYGYILENILSELYPLHSGEFKKLSETVSLCRMIQGVHFKTDIDAARKLTDTIYPTIKQHLNT